MSLNELKSNGDELVLKFTTWHKDSHGLYDYETKQIEKKSLKVKET